jgi:hypothetical protein
VDPERMPGMKSAGSGVRVAMSARRWTKMVMRCIRPPTLWPSRSALTVDREFKLTTRLVLSVGLAAFASLGAATLYVHRNAPPTCTSELTLDRVSELLRDNYHLDSIIVNHIRTVSGGFLSTIHDCAAEVTEIRGGEDASGMAWQEIRYRIVHQDESSLSAVTLALGDRVPLAPQTPSLWTRLLAYL